MRNFTLPRGPCSFLNSCISPWEIPFLLLLCSSSLCHSFPPPAAAPSGCFPPPSLCSASGAAAPRGLLPRGRGGWRRWRAARRGSRRRRRERGAGRWRGRLAAPGGARGMRRQSGARGAGGAGLGRRQAAGHGVDVGELGHGCWSWHAEPRRSERMEDRRSCRSSHAGARRLDSAEDGSGRSTRRWRRWSERGSGNWKRRSSYAGRWRAG
jgi:hypothetical protein